MNEIHDPWDSESVQCGVTRWCQRLSVFAGWCVPHRGRGDEHSSVLRRCRPRYHLLIAVNGVLVSPVRLGPGAGLHRLLLLPYLAVVSSQHGSPWCASHPLTASPLLRLARYASTPHRPLGDGPTTPSTSFILCLDLALSFSSLLVCHIDFPLSEFSNSLHSTQIDVSCHLCIPSRNRW